MRRNQYRFFSAVTLRLPDVNEEKEDKSPATTLGRPSPITWLNSGGFNNPAYERDSDQDEIDEFSAKPAIQETTLPWKSGSSAQKGPIIQQEFPARWMKEGENKTSKEQGKRPSVESFYY